MATADNWIAGRANGIKAAVFLVAFAAVTFVFINQSLATGRVEVESTKLLVSLADNKQGAKKVALPSVSDLRSAVAADPYSQDMVNAAVVARYFRDHDKTKLARGMKQVDQLGWRSTTALQNHIQLAMERRDLVSVIDIADALLRREKLVEQATVLMNYMELTPETRKMLASKLVASPSWRGAYLANAASLKRPLQVEARGSLLNELFARKDQLTRDELSPSLSAMTAAGRARAAYTIWRKFENQPAALLNDPQFEIAAKTGVSPYFAIPFEWQFGAANGYWSEVFRENGDTLVRINWNGKFVPELMKQQTVLDPGSYRLVVTGQGMDTTEAAQLDFALICGRDLIRFDKVMSRTSSRIVLALGSSSTCANPLFVVAGQPATAVRTGAGAMSFGMSNDVSIVLKSIDIIRDSSAPAKDEANPNLKGPQ